jgi:hypothetical protein
MDEWQTALVRVRNARGTVATMIKNFLCGLLLAASTLTAISGSVAVQRYAFYEGYSAQQLDCLSRLDMSPRHCGVR